MRERSSQARARPVRAQEPHPPLRRRLDYVGGKTGKTPCTRGGPGQGSAALISPSAIRSKRRSVGNHRFRHDHIHRRRGAPFKEALTAPPPFANGPVRCRDNGAPPPAPHPPSAALK